MKEVYIFQEEKIAGPFLLNDLHLKKISNNTFIYCEGFSKWLRAKNVPWMHDYINAANEIDSDTDTIPIALPAIKKIEITDKFFGYTLATKKERFMVFLINTCIYLMFLTVILMAVFSLFFLSDKQDLEEGFFSGFLGFYVKNSMNYVGIGIAVLIGFAFYPKFSGTIGHQFLGLKVISSKDGSDYNSAAQGIIRELLKSALSFFLIPFIWILWDNDNQNLYDKAANTYVVKKHYSETLFG
ncbi:MAG: RDD family protein [Bacteroidetes bacterium]|nr:RDD family protein [Bacteroidota bacterium]